MGEVVVTKHETFTVTPGASAYKKSDEIRSTAERKRKILSVWAKQTTNGYIECYYEGIRIVYVRQENFPTVDYPLKINLDLRVDSKFEFGARDTSGAAAEWQIVVEYEETIVTK